MATTTHHTTPTRDDRAVVRAIRRLSSALARAAYTGVPPCVLWPSPFVPMDRR